MLIRSPKELAMFIASQRKKLESTQAQVGSLVGLKQQTISAFENKPEGTKLETLFRILSAINMDMEILPKDNTNKIDKKWDQEW